MLYGSGREGIDYQSIISCPNSCNPYLHKQTLEQLKLRDILDNHCPVLLSPQPPEKKNQGQEQEDKGKGRNSSGLK